MASPKFENSRIVDENKKEVWERIFDKFGSRNISELSRTMEIKKSTVSNWTKDRPIPVEFIVDFCIKYDVSIDYMLLGKEPGQKVIFVGDPTVSHSNGVQQVLGSGPVTGTNITSTSQEHRFNPALQRLIRLLEHYGSPALYQKIEKMVLDMYGDEKPENL